MRAVVADRARSAPCLVERPRPTPGPRELLVRVRAAALNYADLLQVRGEFDAPAGESDVLGVELAGDVVERGADLPALGPAAVFGLVSAGAYADYCVIDAGMAVEIPFGFSYAEAAAIPEVFFTADTTLFGLGNLTRGESVLVHGGGGGLGSACIQLAKSVGARVACTVGSTEKAERAGALGADRAIDHRSQDFVKEVLDWTSGEGVALVIDIVGAAYFQRNLAALKDGGCLVHVGVQDGTICELDIDTLIMRRLRLAGTVMRPLALAKKHAIAQRFRERWLPAVAERRILPVVDSLFDISNVVDAHLRLARSQHFGKVVLDVERATAIPFRRLEATGIQTAMNQR